MASHWTIDGVAMPYVPLIDDWQPEADRPAFVRLYEASRLRFADRLRAAAIPVERIDRLVLVAGGDDQVWPALPMVHAITPRRREHGLQTVLIADPAAGHRTILPGEPVHPGGMRMQRGGTVIANRRLGRAA